MVNGDVESRFISFILARLYFTGLSDRYKAISCVHPETFQWVFDESHQQIHPDDCGPFPCWLSATDCSNLYWVSGKPGSGKSTMMKFLSSHGRTATHLHAWAKDRPLVKGSFFSTSLGYDLQNSRMGLLRALLHAALKRDRKTLVQIFRQRWQQFLAFGGGRQPFTWLELRQSFTMMVSAPLTPRSFFFAIDGLDEIDGDPKELLHFIMDVVKLPHVKICVTSRPLPVFLRAFGSRPCLRLERYNRQDIYNYITASFEGDELYAKLSKLDPGSATNIVNDVAKKAAGIFLWAYVAVHLLLSGLSTTTRIYNVTARLDALPSGLEQLFTKLLGSLDTIELKHACQLLRLVSMKTRPSLLELWFADCENDDLALRNVARPLTENEIVERLKTMKSQLNSRCRGLLEVESSHNRSSAVPSKGTFMSCIKSDQS